MRRVFKRGAPDCPPDAVYIGRPSIFGNPYKIGRDLTREQVISAYEANARARCELDPAFKARVKALHGKPLMCYCAPLPCHGDILVKLAAEFTREAEDA